MEVLKIGIENKLSNKRYICTGLGFIKVSGSKHFLGMPLWKERIKRQLERIAR